MKHPEPLFLAACEPCPRHATIRLLALAIVFDIAGVMTETVSVVLKNAKDRSAAKIFIILSLTLLL